MQEARGLKATIICWRVHTKKEFVFVTRQEINFYILATYAYAKKEKKMRSRRRGWHLAFWGWHLAIPYFILFLEKYKIQNIKLSCIFEIFARNTFKYILSYTYLAPIIWISKGSFPFFECKEMTYLLMSKYTSLYLKFIYNIIVV